jgi:hypothetical protein
MNMLSYKVHAHLVFGATETRGTVVYMIHSLALPETGFSAHDSCCIFCRLVAEASHAVSECEPRYRQL